MGMAYMQAVRFAKTAATELAALKKQVAEHATLQQLTKVAASAQALMPPLPGGNGINSSKQGLVAGDQQKPLEDKACLENGSEEEEEEEEAIGFYDTKDEDWDRDTTQSLLPRIVELWETLKACAGVVFENSLRKRLLDVWLVVNSCDFLDVWS